MRGLLPSKFAAHGSTTSRTSTWMSPSTGSWASPKCRVPESRPLPWGCSTPRTPTATSRRSPPTRAAGAEALAFNSGGACPTSPTTRSRIGPFLAGRAEVLVRDRAEAAAIGRCWPHPVAHTAAAHGARARRQRAFDGGDLLGRARQAAQGVCATRLLEGGGADGRRFLVQRRIAEVSAVRGNG